MDTDTLVEKQLDDGQKFLDDLKQHGYPVSTGLWARRTEDEKWRFIVVTPLVDTEGLGPAYLRLHPHAWSIPASSTIDPVKITLIGLDDPLGREVLAIHETRLGTRGYPIRWEGRLEKSRFNGAYIYPLMTAPTPA
jgi:hypothetical protein